MAAEVGEPACGTCKFWSYGFCKRYAPRGNFSILHDIAENIARLACAVAISEMSEDYDPYGHQNAEANDACWARTTDEEWCGDYEPRAIA